MLGCTPVCAGCLLYPSSRAVSSIGITGLELPPLLLSCKKRCSAPASPAPLEPTHRSERCSSSHRVLQDLGCLQSGPGGPSPFFCSMASCRGASALDLSASPYASKGKTSPQHEGWVLFRCLLRPCTLRGALALWLSHPRDSLVGFLLHMCVKTDFSISFDAFCKLFHRFMFGLS